MQSGGAGSPTCRARFGISRSKVNREAEAGRWADGVEQSPDQKIAKDGIGSAAPVRDFQMQPFGRELVAVVGRHSRTTAVANSDLPDGFGEGQVPKWTGRSPK